MILVRFRYPNASRGAIVAGELLLTGFDEFNRMLRRLKGSAKKVMRRSFRIALRPVQALAKQLAPYSTGALRQSIKIRAGKFSRRRIVVRVTTGDRTLKGKRFYSGFQHWGWRPGIRPKNQSNPQTDGIDFLKQAADEKESQIEVILIREVGAELEREAKLAL